MGWQSAHLTQWMLCLESLLEKVVSMVSTSRLQLDILGWQVAQLARVEPRWGSWQARQEMPSCTPMGVRSSPVPTREAVQGAWHW